MKVQLLGLCSAPIAVEGLGPIQAGEGQVVVAHLVTLEQDEEPKAVARKLEQALTEKRSRK